jgi:hypothetical protein
MSADACEKELHAAGWSIGDLAIHTPTGVVWMVYARRGEQRIVAKAPKQADAWRAAAKMMVRVDLLIN